MSKEEVKAFLDLKEAKPEKRPMTVYVTDEELAKLDAVVKEFDSSRTVIIEAMINIYTKGE